MRKVSDSSSPTLPLTNAAESATSRSPRGNGSPQRQRAGRSRSGPLGALPSPHDQSLDVEDATAQATDDRTARPASALRVASRAPGNPGGAAERGGPRAKVDTSVAAAALMVIGGGSWAAYTLMKAEQSNDPSGAWRSGAMFAASLTMAALTAMWGNKSPAPVAPETLARAVNMLNGSDPATDLSATAGAHATHVMQHLQDIAELPATRLNAAVLGAVERSANDPQQLVRNLIQLVSANPPVRSERTHAQLEAAV